MESKSEAGLQVGGGGSSGGGGAGGSSSGGGGEPEKKSLLKGFDARKAFARCVGGVWVIYRVITERTFQKKYNIYLCI